MPYGVMYSAHYWLQLFPDWHDAITRKHVDFYDIAMQFNCIFLFLT